MRLVCVFGPFVCPLAHRRAVLLSEPALLRLSGELRKGVAERAQERPLHLVERALRAHLRAQ